MVLILDNHQLYTLFFQLLDFQIHEKELCIEAKAKTTAKTGIEMEAMVAVSVAALTIYDMCKGTDRTMRFEGVRLVEKRGGRSGDIVLGGSDQSI